MPPPPPLSAEGGAEFQQGISLILSRWSALLIAVENEFGGRDSLLKPHQLAADIFSFFTQSKEPLYIDELEELLDEFMLTLNTEIDDGSIEEIAEKLMIMHEECLEGNYQSVHSLKDNPPQNGVSHIRQEGNNDDESGEEGESSEMAVDVSKSHSHWKNSNEEMMINEPRSNEPVETDNWTVVAPRRNRGRKN